MPDTPILLVEDDTSDFRLIQRAFGKLENAIPMIRLSNGDEVVDYLTGDAPYENRAIYPLPSLILLDIKLPRRSGFEVLEWIRKQRSTIRRLPVVMLTSSRHSADVNRAYDLGANSYLAKPDSAAQLTQMASLVQSYWFHCNRSPDMAEGLFSLGNRG